MKRSILMAALGLAMANGSFGAPCTSGSTILALSTCALGTVTVSNNGNSWTLSDISAGAITSSGYGIPGGTNANAFMTASWAPYTVGNRFGFSVTFSAAGNTNLFNASSGQQAAFTTNFTVTANQAASNINSYGLFISGWAFTDSTAGDVDPSVLVTKTILDNSTTFSSLQASQNNLFPNPLNISGITQPDFTVVDGYQINAGENGASASVTSYTNYFLPAATQNPAAVPEPSAFVLMGAGLAGVAALRRRQRRAMGSLRRKS